MDEMAKNDQEGGAYSATLNLPKTDFPMKGDLPKREPERLEAWKRLGLYERLQERQKGRKAWVLHDGPPYANGHIHIGHALNKVLKDMSVKAHALMGFAAPYVPGWDCHGLPIETALLKEKKMSKRGITDIPAFRKDAEAFAERFIDLQRGEFKRLGVLGDWERPYKTLARGYEAAVLKAFRLLLKEGYIYRGLKPVYWCVTCESALAEAEIEYKEKESPSVYVAFPVKQAKLAQLSGAEALIWTTTPWTLPANRAVAFHPELLYRVVEVETALGRRKLLFAEKLRDAVLKAVAKDPAAPQARDLGPALSGREIVASGLEYERPFGGSGVAVTAEYVTAEDGTGVVHTAPGHGADDFATGQKYGLEIFNPVDNSGRYGEAVGPALAGKQIFSEGNPAVIAELTQRGWMLRHSKVQHSYPHCWRCKNPVVFRTTEQWFLNVGHEGLRGRLLSAIDQVQWIPAEGKQRISAMVENRPDWCLSRQRVWGTPIPVLFCASCRKPATGDDVLESLEREVARNGDAFWFSDWGREISAADWAFLPRGLKCADCGGERFTRETDILDVWVDSGASWLGVLEPRGQAPCELYLEGSDQHRGWFQSSLVLSVALTGKAPYETVLTHGFVLDEKGRAMHKSAGNVVAPQEVVDKYGADVLRLWVALSDYSDDVRISDKLLSGPVDDYRKFRNTVRYLLGNAADFSPAQDALAPGDLPELERYVLHRLAELERGVLADYGAFRYRAAARRLVDFCAFDLSSFYLDVLKDRLYTYAPGHPARRAAQTVMVEALRRLLLLASPILSFTAEEAWQFAPKRWGWEESVFLADLPPAPAGWTDAALASRWALVLEARAAAQKALEEARKAKTIGSSLEAKAVLTGPVPSGLDWAELLVVSQAEVKDGPGPVRAEVSRAGGAKCARCWRYQSDVGASAEHPGLCGRCAGQLGRAAASPAR